VWLRMDTTFWSHEKLLALPSDAARWSWLVLLSRAKERDGAFSSETQLKVDLGPRRYRWVKLFRELGLLDGLQIHDWDAYQLSRDNSVLRTRRWRARRSGDGDGDASRDGPTGTLHGQGRLEREAEQRESERTLPDESTRAAVYKVLGRDGTKAA